MFKRFSVNYLILLFLLDIICVQTSFWLATKLRYVLPFGETILPEWADQYFYQPNLSLFIAIGFLWSAIFLLFSCYTPRRIIFWFDEFQRIVLAHTFAALSLAGLLYLANILLLRLVFVYFYVLVFVVLLGYRAILRLFHRLQSSGTGSVARILIIGAGPLGRRVVTEFTEQQWPGIELIGFLNDDHNPVAISGLELPILGRLNTVADVVREHKVDEVIIALPREEHTHMVNLVARLHELPVRLRVVPDYSDLAFHGATIENLGRIPLIGLRDPAIDGFQRLAKRMVDMVAAFLGLLLSAPMFVLTACAIKLEDGGDIFYRAPRIGENGKLFYMLKFRSMIENADKIQPEINLVDEDSGSLIHKTKDDPRITQVGRLLRRTSVDELPQLWNVLKGEMSLVGPRPELPWMVELYEPWQRKRFAVPQGITGWWQINGRSDNMMHLHTDQDLYYIQNFSIWLDFQILWKTVGVVLRGKGAY